MNKIKKIRLFKGLTVQSLSNKSGVAIGYIADLENGKALNPTIKTLSKIAKALQVEVIDLLDS
ncbi:helix-turn-helix domain-containing protein [Hathewaya limosa]|uniref:Transcriptional regulator with XRE-family HTH domain n=1 Tax=Hathewaya limosa TaxID=1536 RepID=A0ABU0JTK8_HATLI|nr:helix-turn-helix transcriptional regulator [Hathewaya limosa]AWZ48305.1 XRE family transcriptional regulator [Clostridiaceae bacterium 14S0207]MDQ0479740.1 transcriptional regulator with XRE-family HTH domain [Hathewaya limosa]